jgi:SRSO17 transposase
MKKLFGLVESLTELPDAIHAILKSHHENVERRIEERCEELNAENDELKRKNSTLTSHNAELQRQLGNWLTWAGCIGAKYMAPIGTSLSMFVKDKFAELELYKSRDIESRRWRKQREESCPLKGSEWVLYRDYGSDESLSCLAKYLMPGNEWRYVSPEDMP